MSFALRVKNGSFFRFDLVLVFQQLLLQTAVELGLYQIPKPIMANLHITKLTLANLHYTKLTNYQTDTVLAKTVKTPNQSGQN